MPTKIALDSFLAVAKRSNLLTAEQLKSNREAFEGTGGDVDDARTFAEFLVKQRVLTPWQADKLLQGKHKGFFLGKYRLLSLLGKGGMSSVYLAEHVLMRRRCAIKVLPTKRVHDTSYLGRFHREAQAVAALDDPNIVRAYDVDHEVDGDMEIHFLVMEYVDGKSLLDLVQDNGRLSPVEAADFIRQAALGLAHAHQAGLVHRDIKPGNLLVDSSGVVKLLDLGLARFFAGSEDVALTIQHDEKVLGTADYLAPEQAVDSHLVDARADIYSLGCTLYFLLTGHPPFTEGTLTQRLLSHQTKEPPGVETERSDVPQSLLAILKRMMAKHPDDRYQSCEAVASELADWLRANGGGERVPGSDKGSDLNKRQPATDTRAGTASVSVPEKGASRKQTQKAPPTDSRKRTPADQTEPELGAFLAGLGDTADAVHQRDRPVKAPAQPPRREPGGKPASDPSRVRGKAQRTAPAAAIPRVTSDVGTVVQGEPVDEAIPVAEPDEQAPTIVTHDTGTSTPAGGDKSDSMIEAAAVAEPISAIQKRRRRRGRRNIVVTWSVVAVVTVVAVVIGYIVSQDSSESTAEPAPAPEDIQVADGVAGAASTGYPDNLGPEIRVGGDGEFPTISDAITYVEERADRFGPENPWVILVKGGEVFDERLVIRSSSFEGFPEGSRIASDGAAAVLRPQGGEGPVIDLVNTTDVTIDGFLIDAGGGDVAIRLSEFLLSTRLENLEIVNFAVAGIDSRDAWGLQGRPVRMRNLTIRAGDSSAVGMRLENVREAEVTDCRFIGPMRAGLELPTSSRTTNVTIRQCRLHELQTGVLFRGVRPDLQSISLVNNTFHRVQQGVVISQMPQAGSSGLALKHNLFSGISAAEAVVEQGYEAGLAAELLAPGDAVNNWSERSGDPAGTNELDVFATGGRRGIEEVSFASRDPAAGNFLKPGDPAFRLEPGETAEDAARFVGAMPP